MLSQIRPLVSAYDHHIGFGLAVGGRDCRLNPNCPLRRQKSNYLVIHDLYDAVVQRIVSHLRNNPSFGEEVRRGRFHPRCRYGFDDGIPRQSDAVLATIAAVLTVGGRIAGIVAFLPTFVTRVNSGWRRRSKLAACCYVVATISRAFQSDSRTYSTYRSSENGLMMYDLEGHDRLAVVGLAVAVGQRDHHALPCRASAWTSSKMRRL